MIIDSYRYTASTPPAPAVNGYLYNWWAASDPLFAPTDWKVPTDADYIALSTFLGGTAIAGGKMKETGLTYWNSPNAGADNSSGFTGYGSGARSSIGGSFVNIKLFGLFWSSNEASAINGYYSFLDKDDANFLHGDLRKANGLSIRLLYTGAGAPTAMTDYDGTIYDVVLIGSQYWTVQNWKCTKLNNGTPLTKGGSDPNFFTNAEWAALTTEGYCAYDNDEGNV